MAKTIDFYFDFSSPYGFYGSLFIDNLGVDTSWRPYLMGAAMKETGIPALIDVPYKREYAWIDLKRTARLNNEKFWMPSYFPFASVQVCRAFYVIENLNGHAQAKEFAVNAMRNIWTRGGSNMSDINDIVELSGIKNLQDLIGNQPIKDRLRAVTNEALKRGCWGSPHYFVNDGDASEHFWGSDKRWQIERWLDKPW